MGSFIEFVYVATGGALGAMSRFGIAKLAAKWQTIFPFGTLVANLLGCLMIGILIGSGKADGNHPLRLAFGVGFLGSLTTFSTFSAETLKSANEGAVSIAFSNVAANLLVGLVLVAVGIWIGRSAFPDSGLDAT